jgi:hypothetical protein
MREVGQCWCSEAEGRRKGLSNGNILYAERKRIFLHIVLKCFVTRKEREYFLVGNV